MRAGIAGAGLLGLLLAWQLKLKGWKVTLFDKDEKLITKSAAYAAAGMLSPYIEIEIADKLIVDLGLRSIALWKSFLGKLSHPVYFQQNGSIIVSHSNDKQNLDYLIHKIKIKHNCNVDELDKRQLQAYEPELTFNHGYYFPLEGQIDNRQLLKALYHELTDIACHTATDVLNLTSHCITTLEKKFYFDWVFDCRGYGAAKQFKEIRGIKGELIYLNAPEVYLTRPIRLIHPRYRLYIVPRQNNNYLIGASEIESDDTSSISVRTCLELLTGTYSVHPGFGEAKIIETVTGIRAAFFDNLPRIYYQPGLIAMNGLYRHGFLLAPILIQETINLIEKSSSSIPDIIKEANYV